MLTRRAALIAPFLLRRASAASEPRLVVASTTIHADLVRAVCGDTVTIRSLVPPDGDPHDYEPKPSDLVELTRAVAVVENGLGLEGWLPRAISAAGSTGQRIVASAGVHPRVLQEGAAAVPDPHIWQDPVLGQLMVRNIAAGLAKAEPGRADAIQSKAMLDELAAIDAEIRAAYAPIPRGRRKVLTTHDAFSYYGARYGVDFIALEGISPDAEPSPRALTQAAAQAKRLGITTVFLENMLDPRLPQALAREAGLRVGPKLYSDALSPADGPAPRYVDLLRFNTKQLVASMQAH